MPKLVLRNIFHTVTHNLNLYGKTWKNWVFYSNRGRRRCTIIWVLEGNLTGKQKKPLEHTVIGANGARRRHFFLL